MFLLFGCVLQLWLIIEFLLRRFLKLVIGTSEAPLCRYADRNFMSISGGVLVDVLTAPFQILLACLTTPIVLLLIFAIVVCLALTASDTNAILLVTFVDSYNAVAPIINRIMDLWGIGVQFVSGVILPIWNAIVVFLNGLLFEVFGPVLWSNAQAVADVLENTIMTFGALADAMAELSARASTCAEGDWGSDLRCVDPEFLTLDLMTPGLFMRQAIMRTVETFASVCKTTSAMVYISSYPFVDYNLYKAIHCLFNTGVQIVMHTLASLHRCGYAEKLPLSRAEKSVACSVDFGTLWTYPTETIRALGQVFDNWLDITVDVVLSQFDETVECANRDLADVSALEAAAASVFEAHRPQRVVGLSQHMLALTDGRDVVYRTAGEADVWSLRAWPFDVDVKHGVAAVSSPLSIDFDRRGSSTTGMLGCRCYDAPFRVMCATIPHSRTAQDETDAYMVSTQHVVHFADDVSLLTCSQVLIKVTPLRFSRRRAAVANAGGDASARDRFGERESAARALHKAADAGIYVQPWCGTGDPLCVESVSPCFPFCLGLHVGSYGAQNITMYNARTWDDYVSVRQTDCAVQADLSASSCVSLEAVADVFTEVLVTGHRTMVRCKQQCVASEDAVSFVSLPKYADGQDVELLERKAAGFPRVRMEKQPFVIAGDVMLTENTQNNAVDVIRLYNNGRGAFALQNEHLSLVSNAREIELVDCEGDERPACVSNAAKNGQLPRPRSYFFTPEQLPAVSSEWGVHWAANPPNEVYQAFFDFCSQGVAVTALMVHSSYSRARVWTLRTMREHDMTSSGSDPTSPVAYMLIPNWFSAEDAHPERCMQLSALKVTAVEYINAENVLVTVLEARPQDWRVFANDVCDTCPRVYKHYFINPNRHDCFEPRDGPGNHFTCWRESMWPSHLQAAVPGQLCPAKQRAPPVLSVVTEGLVLIFRFLQMLTETLVCIPAAAAGGDVTVLQKSARSQPTLHTMLDSGGSQLLAVEPIIDSYQQIGFKISLCISKTFAFFAGLRGHNLLEPIVMGAATVVGANPASVTLPFQLEAIRKLPMRESLSSAGESSLNVAGSLPLGGSRLALMVLSLADYFTTLLRIIRRILVSILRGGSSPGKFVGSLLQAALYESQQDIRSGLLESARMQCGGLASVARGSTLSTEPGENAFSGFVLHVCQVGPDLVEGVFEVTRVLFAEYPTMSCLCKKAQGERTVSGFDDVSQMCLSRVVPLSLREWSLGLVFSEDNADGSQADLCFAAMDGANARLERAFDRTLSRLYLASTFAAEALDYLLSAVSLDREKCNAYQSSAYVVAIVPEPVDYFLTCLNIADCRARCFNEYTAFEDSLAALQREGVGIPSFENNLDVAVESPIFDPALTDTSEDEPPFTMYGMTELTLATCAALCNSDPVPRCVAVAGLNEVDAELAYYCLPLDITQYIYRFEMSASFSLPQGMLLDMFVATDFRAKTGEPDWLIVHVYNNGEYEIHLCIAGLNPRRLLMTAPRKEGQTESGVGYLQAVSRVDVAAALHPGALTVVTVVGKRRVADNAQGVAETIALCLDISTAQEDSEIVLNWRECEVPPARKICVITGSECGKEELFLDEQTLRWEGHEYEVPNTLKTTNLQLYATSGGTAPSRTLVSPVVARRETEAVEIITVDTRNGYKSWLHVVTLVRDNDEVRATARASIATRQTVPISVECRVDRCVGCQTADQNPAFVELQARCYAAQQCGIARCAGSLVNMRKPLCSLGKLLAQQLVVMQASMGVLWQSVAQNIVFIVEISESRRRNYELKFADEAVATAICTVKDANVQTAATLTSLIGALASLDYERRFDQVAAPGVVLDTRAHARTIMVLTALTDTLATVLNFPVYVALGWRKLVSCTVNDGLALLESATGFSLFIGSREIENRAQRITGVCLTATEVSTMTRVAEDASDVAIADLIAGVSQLPAAAFLESMVQSTDVFLAWSQGVVTGFMDVAQTSDWEGCKTSRVDFTGIATCACGDVAYQIPAEQRKARISDGAWWCAGLLAMTAADGSEVVVYNPYSLEELLSGVDMDKYLECLARGVPANCARPRKQELERQGVELAQVVTQCRDNYLQRRWDDGALLYALWTRDEWLTAKLIPKDDEFTDLRLRVRQLYREFPSLATVVLALDETTLTCLHKALYTNDFNHMCHIGSTFEYRRADPVNFETRDACESFSRASKYSTRNRAALPPTLWSGSSENRMPLATRHSVVMARAERLQAAESELVQLVQENVLPMMREMDGMLESNFADHLRVEAWSVEGDELHQFVDCVVLGPFSAAALMPSVRLASGQSPSPLYHRGSPHSRSFLSSGVTGGSSTRQKLMHRVVERVQDQSLASLVDGVREHVDRVKRIFLAEEGLSPNLLCACNEGPPSLECCSVTDDITTVSFGAAGAFSDRVWDLQSSVMTDIFAEVAQDAALFEQDLWSDPDLRETDYVAEISPQQQAEMLRRHIFEGSVFSYDEIRTNEGNGTLWDACSQLLSTPTFTLPLYSKTVLDALGLDREEMKVHAKLQYDPTQPVGEFMHEVESAVHDVLRQAEQKSPVFYSHVHRYVPSDSVWCDDIRQSAKQPSGVAEMESELAGHTVNAATITAPSLEQVLFYGDESANVSTQPSTLWGLLDSGQHFAWYSGAQETWRVDLREIATNGPAGVRLGTLHKPAQPETLPVAMPRLTQPVCESGLPAVLVDDLRTYFQDTFFPMAHSVSLQTAHAYCARWVVETALDTALQMRGKTNADAAAVWKERCASQLELRSVCDLRDVWSIAKPHGSEVPFSDCGLVVPDHLCSDAVYTVNCLVRCNGTFYDPCACSSTCELTANCQPIVHVSDPVLKLSSLQYPDEISLEEGGDANMIQLLERLRQERALYGPPSELRSKLAAETIAADQGGNEGVPPDAWCDDLFDYWPEDAQHPIGYHPTSACARDQTRLRGFVNWMSATPEGNWAVDPIRQRNATAASVEFGAAHLVCDALALLSRREQLADLFVNSRWDPNARADPAMPRKAIPDPTEEELQMLGTPSFDPFDTPAFGDDEMMLHSVGLIWNLVRWPGTKEEQLRLDARWPLQTLNFGSVEQEAACAEPPLLTCQTDENCADGLICLQGETDGVCSPVGTCFRHSHCSEHEMCSGEGQCVQPQVRFNNDAFFDVATQLFSASPTCTADSFGASHFQHSKTFARDQGLCAFRNWWQYYNLTADAAFYKPGSRLRVVNDKVLSRIDEPQDDLMSELGILRMTPHVCDRSYQHTNFKACSSNVQGVEGYKATRTWQNSSKGLQATFCDLTENGGNVFGFLAPYTNDAGLLKIVSEEVQRCSLFDVCPRLPFEVQGVAVYARKVRQAQVSRDGIVQRSSSNREYCWRDAHVCRGVGYLQGSHCSDTENICVPDPFVLPVLAVLQAHPSVESLRQHCFRAFTGTTVNFQTTLVTLQQSYLPDQAAAVMDTANRAMLAVFGIEPSQAQTDADNYMEKYLEDSKCAAHVAMLVSENVQSDVYQELVTVGSSMYLFQDRVAVFVSFDWLWRCVIIPVTGRGAKFSWWYEITGSETFDSNALSCVNADETQLASTIPPDETMMQNFSQRLQTAPHVFLLRDSNAVFGHQIMEDVQKLIFDELQSLSMNIDTKIKCVESNDNILTKLSPLALSSATGNVNEGSGIAASNCCQQTANDDIIYLPDEVIKALFLGKSVGKNPTIETLIAEGILKLRDANDVVKSTQNVFPAFSFVALQQSAPVDAEVFLTSTSNAVSNPGALCYRIDDQSLFSNSSGALFTLEHLLSRVFDRLRQDLSNQPSFHAEQIISDSFTTNTLFAKSTVAPNVAGARTYNAFMESHKLNCQPTNSGFDFNAESNWVPPLMRMCLDEMKTDLGWKQPSRSLMTVQVSASVLHDGFYPAFSELQSEDAFLDNLFSKQWASRQDPTHAICFQRDGMREARNINPYWAGDFDFDTGCDTQLLNNDRFVHTSCQPRETQKTAGFCGGNFPTWEREVLLRMAAVCVENDEKRIDRTKFDSLLDTYTPLCERMPTIHASCDRAYGTLHGQQGQPVTTLYSKMPIVELYTGVWNASVFRGRREVLFADSAALKVLRTDIGGHAIGFRIADHGEMFVECFDLASKQTCARPVVDWMQTVENDWEWQHRYYKTRLMSGSFDTPVVTAAWHCPLQWLASVSGLPLSFAARSPSPLRNAVRFRHITQKSIFAHPTVASIVRVSALHPARFLSERLACIDTSCDGHLGTVTQQALNIGQWSFVRFVGTSCNRSLDWPSEPYVLRDDGLRRGRHLIPCIAADRFPAFQIGMFRHSVRTLPPTGPVAACRMGRLRRIAALSDTNIIQRCTSAAQGLSCLVLDTDAGIDGARLKTKLVLENSPPRRPTRRSHHPRRKCSACEQPTSKFVNRDGSHTDLDPPHKLRQLSTAVPIKLATERILASTLRRRLCGTQTTCLGLNASSWQSGSFLHNLLPDAKNLYTNAEVFDNTESQSDVIDDALFWNRPWVFCDIRNGTGCNGSVSKDSWLSSPATRRTSCATAVMQSSTNPRTYLHFCLLNEHTKKLCREVVRWENSIRKILCEAGGACPKHSFFYVPSVYNLNNRNFVRDSVVAFYNQVGAECPVDVVSLDDFATQIGSRGACSAFAFEEMREIIKALRKIVNLIVRIAYYTANVVLYLFHALFVFVMNASQALKDNTMYMLNRYFELWLESLKDAVEAIIELVKQLVEKQGFFKDVLEIFHHMCRAIAWIYNNVIKAFLCNIVFPVLRTVVHEIAKILKSLLLPGSGELFAFAQQLENMAMCLEDWEPCPRERTFRAIKREMPLPSATRCWSTYATFFADTQQLSCSALDTCQISRVDTATAYSVNTEDKREGLTTCHACPPVHDNPLLKKYGCDDLTKVCTCGVTRLQDSVCFSNSECDDTATCRFVSSDLDLLQTGDPLPCSACQTTRVCLIERGQSVGTCACTLFQQQFATCAAIDRGVTVQPRSHSLCLFNSDPLLQNSIDYRSTMAAASTVPCRDLAYAYCFLIADAGLGSDIFMLIGLSPLSRRRLLATSEDIADAFLTKSALCRDALENALLPHVREDCVEAFLSSRATVEELEMDLPANAFASSADMLHLLGSHPFSCVQIASQPAMLLTIVTRHTYLKHVLQISQILSTAAVTFAHLALTSSESPFKIKFEKGFAVVTAHDDAWQPAAIAVQHAVNLALLSNVKEDDGEIKAKMEPEMRGRRLLEISTSLQSSMETTATSRRPWPSQEIADIFGFQYDTSQTEYSTDNWPPQAVGIQQPSCQVFSDTLNVIKNTAAGFRAATTARPVRPPWNFTKAWPSLKHAPENSLPTYDSATEVVRAVIEYLLNPFGISIQTINNMAFSAIEMLKNSLTCDQIAVQTCSKWHVPVAQATFVVIILMSYAWVVLSALNANLLIILLLLPLSTWFVWEIAYGFSWRCFPMIPVCFFSDTFAATRDILPHSLQIPVLLLCNPNIENSLPCLSSRCSDFGFTSWVAVVAATAVELDLQNQVLWIASRVGYESTDLDNQMQRQSIALRSEDPNVVAATRVCYVSNAHTVLPFVVVAVIGVTALFQIVRLLMALLMRVVQLLLELVATASVYAAVQDKTDKKSKRA